MLCIYIYTYIHIYIYIHIYGLLVGDIKRAQDHVDGLIERKVGHRLLDRLAQRADVENRVGRTFGNHPWEEIGVGIGVSISSSSFLFGLSDVEYRVGRTSGNHPWAQKKINRSHTHTHRQRTTVPTPTHTTRQDMNRSWNWCEH